MSGTTTQKPELNAEQQEAIARDTAHVQAIVSRATAGDESAVPELRELLDERSDLWASRPDLSECVLHTWANVICGGDLLLRESIIRDFQLRVNVIMSRNPCQMERILANQVGFFRMQLLHAQTALGQMAAGGFSKASDTVDKRLTASQKRLSRATKDLLAFQRAHGLIPLSKPETVSPKPASRGLDPAQRAAKAMREQAPTPQQADEQATADRPTEVPLRPPVAGTERVVTSESMLAEHEVPNDNIFSGAVGTSPPASPQDHEVELQSVKKTIHKETTAHENTTL